MNAKGRPNVNISVAGPGRSVTLEYAHRNSPSVSHMKGIFPLRVCVGENGSASAESADETVLTAIASAPGDDGLVVVRIDCAVIPEFWAEVSL